MGVFAFKGGIFIKRRFVYICSPYQGDTENNKRMAQQYCRKAYSAGYVPIAPHLLFTQFLNDDIPEEREQGLEMAKDLLRRCYGISICGKIITDGMNNEIMLANKLNKPVISIDETLAARRIGKIPREKF